MTWIKRIFLAVVAIFGLVLTFGSRGAYESAGLFSSAGPEITLGHTSWDDGLASTHVIKHVLEDEGYTVELVQLDPAILFSSVATGDVDFSTSPWLPLTHGAYYERYEEDIDLIGPHTEDAVTGLVVPAYMEDVNSITDLTDQANQEIYGIEPGAGITTATDRALETYDNLSGWTHLTSSTGAMLTELEAAYANEEEIVVAGWTPHWKFITYDLKILDDPEGVYGEGETLATIARQGLADDAPELYSTISNFTMGIDAIGQIMLDMSEGMSADQAAREWVDNNPDQVQEWLSNTSDSGTEGSADSGSEE